MLLENEYSCLLLGHNQIIISFISSFRLKLRTKTRATMEILSS